MRIVPVVRDVRFWSATLLAGALLLGGCTGSPPPARPGPMGIEPGLEGDTPAEVDLAGIGDPYFPSYGNGGYDVASYALKVKFDPATGQLDGTATVKAKATVPLDRFHLDLVGLTVSSVVVEGDPAEVKRDRDELVVTPTRHIDSGQAFTAVVKYGGKPGETRERDADHNGFFVGKDGAVAVGEPQSAAAWFPVNDHPRDKALYTIDLTVPSKLSGLSNGVLKGRKTDGDWTTWSWNVTSPMASYLATMVVGDYRVTQTEHRGKPVIYAIASSVPAGEADRNLARTPEVADFLESLFGPYPFDAYGGIVVGDNRVSDELENQTRPIYLPKTWEKGPDTIILAHELAHQWFGDSVSVQSWRDMWLNEGFATYAEWLWGEHQGGRSVQEQYDRRYRDRKDRMWRVPTADPGSDGIFSSSVYERGAMTLHALRKLVGDDKFFTIMRTWTAEQRDGNASTAEFVTLSERIAGRPLDAFFQPWLYGKTRPE
ncbi:M1 family metallopeptidase [Catellatospora citrea]|uniref:Aminopeptidase N n=1 Tax=Catellatospora citrea TaxID=53366 RepID=A0A8J3P1P7_9ACTN|nr:M1 family metallopeptidase [Catellatospora citrea]GIG00347.1 peptidase [Catellatospora citrea]